MSLACLPFAQHPRGNSFPDEKLEETCFSFVLVCCPARLKTPVPLRTMDSFPLKVMQLISTQALLENAPFNGYLTKGNSCWQKDKRWHS